MTTQQGSLFGPELPPQPSAVEWRQFMRQAAEAYLEPNFNVYNPPTVRAQAAEHGYTDLLHPMALQKAERFVPPTALIHRLTKDYLVAGSGTAAHFARISPGTLEGVHFHTVEAFESAYDRGFMD